MKTSKEAFVDYFKADPEWHQTYVWGKQVLGLMDQFAEQFKQKWTSVLDQTPICYKTGNWDGSLSDFVFAKDIEGNFHVVHVYEGIMDGEKFQHWCDKDDYEIKNIVSWMEIPA